MLVMKDFFDQNFLNKGSNASYIALIPKIEGTDQVMDYRLVNHVGSTYKIISKCLALRLKQVLPTIVAKEEMAFLKGITMVDGVLCANECIDAHMCEGKPGVICKLDLEKAYNHVNWGILIYVLRRCDFGVKWREWMWKCISLVSFSVLVNGVPKGHFGCNRGLWQVDPLSPLIFLLVGVVLGVLIGRATEVGMIKGFFMDQGVDLVCHHQSADDTIIFYDNSQWQIRMLHCVLQCFKAVLSLCLNLTKSSLIAVGEVPNFDQLATDLGCRMGQLPTTYLGLPLGATFKQKEI